MEATTTASVSPNGVPTEHILPPFAKPVAMAPLLSEWPEHYLTRRSQLKRGTVQLSSGRTVAYTDDCAHLPEGSTETVKTVVCIHGMCQSKALFLLPKPLDGVRQISIDRFGYGDSSGDAGYSDTKDNWLAGPDSGYLLMDEQCLDYVEFIDKMGIDKCYLIGHSAGTLVGQATAMLLEKKEGFLLQGVALMGAMVPPHHNKLKNDATWWDLPFQTGTMKSNVNMMEGLSKRGCCFDMLCVFEMVSSSMVYKNRSTKDPGFAGLYTATMKNDDGGSEARFTEMDTNPFMVAATLEAYLHGMNYTATMTCDMYRLMGSSWGHLDDGTITAPMLVFNGEFDTPMPTSLLQFFPKVYPQAKTQVLEGHGHSTMFLELERIMKELVAL